MVSHKHKCIFIHIPKAAGTSIERAFMDDLCLDMNNRHALLLGENTNKDLGPRRVSHLSASEYVNLHFVSQEIYDSYFKFSVVRHPVDRLYSIYKYRTYSDYITFDQFIKLKLPELFNSKREGYFYRSQYDYVFCDKGSCVNFIGKLENITEDFKIIKDNISLETDLRHYNKSKIKSTSFLKKVGKTIKDPEVWLNFNYKVKDKYLSSKAKNIILKYYNIDFKTFNYDL